MSEAPLTDPIWGWRGAVLGIAQRMKHALESGERSDIQFAVGLDYGTEKLFRAHKLVLSLCSDVWDAMFYGEVPETSEIVQVPEILPEAFGVMLKYLYTDGVESLSVQNVLATLYCAKKYGVPKLVDICIDYAVKNVNKTTCLTMLEAAMVLDAEKIVNRCLMVVDRHCIELMQTQEFLELKNETLMVIFCRDTLFSNEEEVYKAAERWAANACRTNQLEPTAADYRAILGEVLFLIRFPLMDDAQLANGPLASGLLLNEEVLKIYQFKHAVKKPEIPFSNVPRSSNIVFCDREWTIGGKCEVSRLKMRPRNVFLDEQGHLHLRFIQDNGLWKGSGVQSVKMFGFGRYEFHIEGLDQVDPNIGFAVFSQEGAEPGLSIDFANSADGNNLSRFCIHDRNSFWPFGTGLASSHQATVADNHVTLLFYRKPDSISFSFQRGHHHNKTTGVLHNWWYDSKPNISQIPLPLLFFLLSPLGKVPSDGKDAEVIIHSFRFYPDE